MKLFENSIVQLMDLFNDYSSKSYQFNRVAEWPDEGKNQMIFQNEMAFELGGSKLDAVSGIAFTDSSDVVPQDEVVVYGPDIKEIKGDTSYARITLVKVRNTDNLDSNGLYQMIRRIDYTRYHINPRGYMMRISAMHQRESVRVGKDALAEGLSFEKVGYSFIDAYHKHPEVEAVKIIFVTLPNFSYKEVAQILQKCENISKTLDHLAKKVQMDCNACQLKEVCEEVEALYEKG